MPAANPEEFEDETDQFSFRKMLPRDERRFHAADVNGDQTSDREEFTSFLHPEEFDHMKDIVVLVRSPQSSCREERFSPLASPGLCVGGAGRLLLPITRWSSDGGGSTVGLTCGRYGF